MVESESHHPDQKNIYRELGCKTPRGRQCTACCTYYKVEMIKKPQGVSCEFRTEHGCAIHNHPKQPNTCKTFHCSQIINLLENPLISDPKAKDTLSMRALDLIEIAYEQHEIGQGEYDQAIARIYEIANRTEYALDLDE